MSLFALVMFLLFSHSALASTAGVSPAWIDGPVVPGETSRFRVNVVNNSRGLLTFDALLGDVWYDPETQQAIYPPAGTSPMSVAPFASVFPERLSVPPGEIASFVVTVEAPADLTSGLYGALRIQSKPYSASSEGIRAQTALSFAVPMLFAPSELGSHQLQLGSASITEPTADGPGHAELTLTNIGTVHERPSLRAAVRSQETGAVVASISGQSSKYLLPGQSRTVAIEWETEVEPGTYEVLGAVRYGGLGVLPVQIPLTVSSAAPQANAPASGDAPEQRETSP